MKATLPVLGILAFALAGCDDGSNTGCNDTGDGTSNCETGDSGDTNDTNAPLASYNWNADGLTVTIENNPGSGFDLGMAETGSNENGWFGEDCFNGTAGFDYCHSFSGNSASLDALGYGTEEATVGDPNDVVPGSTTLFNQDLAFNQPDGSDRLTYMVTFDDRSCIVWGDQPSYYSSFDCTVYE
jgi:hypothetical protein